MRIISEPMSDEAHVFAAIFAFRKLSSWTASCDFWNKTVNDELLPLIRRRRALIQSFDLLKLEIPIKLSHLGRFFSPANWLRQENVYLCEIIMGRVPVQHTVNDLVVCIHFKFDENDDSVVYLTVNREVSQSEIVSALRGEYGSRNGMVTDVAVMPDLESDRSICHKKPYYFPGRKHETEQ